MRLCLCVAVFVVSAAAAFAQSLREVADAEQIPAAISSSIQASMDQNELLHGIRRWEGNLVGDATPDLLVEAFFSPVGGNAVYPRHWIFVGAPSGFSAFFPVELPGSILSAGIEGNAMVITVSTYLDTDARCCPSGVEVIRMPLT